MITPNKELKLRRLEAQALQSELRTDLTKESTDLEVRIEQLIREKYSLSQEIAILRKIHLGKITEEEFKVYSDYVEECIEKAQGENPQPEE